MSDIAWFQTRIDQFFIIGDIPDVETRIYNGLVVDVFEFGNGTVSQINSSIFLCMGLMWENIYHEIRGCHGRNDRVTTRCDPFHSHKPSINILVT